MKEEAGIVFSIADENVPVPGCTISKAVSAENGYYISHFSLAAGTDISAECYRYHKLWIVAGGELTAYVPGKLEKKLEKGDLFVTPVDDAVGVRAENAGVYTEIQDGITVTA